MQKKIILAVFLLCMSHYASAGWQIVKETRDGILYIDPDSIEKNGEYTKAIGFQDFHKMQIHADKSFLSAKFKHEYDCKKIMFRQLELMLFPENMANGEMISSQTKEENWAGAESGSAEEVLLRVACTN